MTHPTVKRWSRTEPVRAACGLRCADVGDGLHVGLIVHIDQEPAFVLHMAWHEREHVVELPERARWWMVLPGLDADEQKELAQVARVVMKRLKDHRLPFGLQAQGAGISRRGQVTLNGANGLNCVTFVMMLFRAANLPLLLQPEPSDLTAQRLTEDKAAQERLVEALEGDDPEHAERVRAEIGTPRVRPEEVAAASGMGDRPVRFGDVMAPGAAVRRSVIAARA